MKNNDWTTKFFNTMYWELFMKRTPLEAQKEARLIASLAPGTTSLLDVCCGVGDIAKEVGTLLDIPVAGIEYSQDYIEKSMIKDIIHGDARVLQTDKQFSLVINWFTSFSYFTPEMNYKILNNCFKYCKNTFLIETYSPYAVLTNLRDNLIYDRIYQGEHYHIVRAGHINTTTRMMEQKWTFTSKNQKFEYDTQSYLYFPDEIECLLYEVGFKQVEIMGRCAEGLCPLDIKTPRFIVRARL